MDYAGICISDLDGTLLPHNGKISATNLIMLEELAQRGICRVLATGRSLFSMSKVVPIDAPFDYVIFATGAGIMDWKKQELIYSQNLDTKQILRVCEVLEDLKLDYMLHNSIPETHHIQYKSFGTNTDFTNRIDIYREFATELQHSETPSWDGATQFLTIVEHNRKDLYEDLCTRLHPLTAIRTTSPLDFCSIWIEIFAPGVNKGEGIMRLLQIIGMSLRHCMVIGNDYNDLHMLELCPFAYVTANAPQELKDKFEVVASCDKDGFSAAVQHWLSHFPASTSS